MLLDGRCQPKSECGVCLDSGGFSKREGDAWQLDSCTQCSCTNATVSCTITACTPISCGLGSEAQTVGHEEGECCPRQVCVPTVGECSTPVAPDCGEFQQAVTVTGEDGCTHFVCGLYHFRYYLILRIFPQSVSPTALLLHHRSSCQGSSCSRPRAAVECQRLFARRRSVLLHPRAPPRFCSRRHLVFAAQLMPVLTHQMSAPTP